MQAKGTSGWRVNTGRRGQARQLQLCNGGIWSEKIPDWHRVPPEPSHIRQSALQPPQPQGEAGRVPGQCATCSHTLVSVKARKTSHCIECATDPTCALYEVCHMPQVARGAAVPCPVPEVEHGSCAFELHNFASTHKALTLVDLQCLGLTAY